MLKEQFCSVHTKGRKGSITQALNAAAFAIVKLADFELKVK